MYTYLRLGQGASVEKDNTVGHSEILLSKRNINKEQRNTNDQNSSPLSEKSQQRHHKGKSKNVWKISESSYSNRKENGNRSKSLKTVNSSQSTVNHLRKEKNNNEERFEAFGNASRRQESKERLIIVQKYNKG